MHLREILTGTVRSYRRPRSTKKRRVESTRLFLLRLVSGLVLVLGHSAFFVDHRLLTLDGFGDAAVFRHRSLADVDLLGDDGALLDLDLLLVERDSDALGVILVDLVGGPPVDRAALDVHLVARHRHVERLLFADDTFADFHRTGLLRRLGGAELLLPKLDGASFSPAILHRGRTDRAGSPGGGHLVPTKLVDLVLVDVQ